MCLWSFYIWLKRWAVRKKMFTKDYAIARNELAILFSLLFLSVVSVIFCSFLHAQNGRFLYLRFQANAHWNYASGLDVFFFAGNVWHLQFDYAYITRPIELCYYDHGPTQSSTIYFDSPLDAFICHWKHFSIIIPFIYFSRVESVWRRRAVVV